MAGSLQSQLRRLGIPDSLIATATVNGKPLADTEPPKRSDQWPGYRSKWEQLLAMELEEQKRRGEILDWTYEATRWKLADPVIVDGKRKPGRWYKIDFTVWLPGGRMRCIEVKGRRWRHAMNDYRAAKDKYRHVEFVMLTRTKTGWETIL